MSEIKRFLEKVAAFILLREEKDLLKTLLIFPNNRSGIFLKNHLRQMAKNDLWLPEMLSIDEFMLQLSGLNLLDPIAVSLKLYEVHKKIEGANARGLDDFLNWAPLMLNDFNDIDFNLVPAQSLFSELSDVKAIEKWNLDGKPLTGLQAQYLKFFHSLFDYYQALHQLLLTDKTAYKGMAYRLAAENSRNQKQELPWRNFIFVGFNALTEAEKAVVKSLKEDYHLDYLIDADSFYFDGHENQAHEAGMFLRDALKILKIKPSWIENQLLLSEKHIEIAQATKHMGQAKYAGKVLQEWFSKHSYEPAKTAVVLLDESLLVPLLASVPLHSGGADDESLNYNVTMGYPLASSPFNDFVDRWLQLLINRQEDGKGRISLPTLSLLFKNSLTDILLGKEGSQFLVELNSRNLFWEKEHILLDEDNNEKVKDFLHTLFQKLDSPGIFLVRFASFMQKLAALPIMADAGYVLLRYQLVAMTKIVKILGVMLKDQLQETSFGTLQKLLSQLIARQEISLKGEPLSGVQLMGLLETRNLDFENIIILGANEGLLPKTTFQDSFIPFDLRRAYQLPLPNNKTAIASYHFFRLLQRAKRVLMVYNSEVESLGGGEASRYILQIENELLPKNPKIILDKRLVNVPLHKLVATKAIRVKKTASVLSRLNEIAQKGFSPSALIAYINCPLQFYYKEVLHPTIPDRLETSIESNTFGSVVHGVLEAIYSQHLGKTIDPNGLISKLSQVDVLLKDQFTEHYGPHDLSYGKNLLMVSVAREYVTRFVKNEAFSLKKNAFILLGLELKLHASLDVGDKRVNIKGFIDRVDKSIRNGQIRIVDYKTGAIYPFELKIKEWDTLISDKKYSKALQVLIYQWLYLKNNKDTKAVAAGLISLRSASGKFLQVTLPEISKQDMLAHIVEDLMVQLINDIFDVEKDFYQTDNLENCNYCDFKNLCTR